MSQSIGIAHDDSDHWANHCTYETLRLIKLLRFIKLSMHLAVATIGLAKSGKCNLVNVTDADVWVTTPGYTESMH
ncbi:MAG: hypothetical protein F6K30_14355 [Cyanothece sp. SIO2G6]|nr:hypothetical protein [Cyanothece sp. SIO2G6]